MGSLRRAATALAALGAMQSVLGDDRIAAPGLELLKTHCSFCHGGAEPKGGFRIGSLSAVPDRRNADLWRKSLEYVRAEFMPPAEAGRLPATDRHRIVAFLEGRIRGGEEQTGKAIAGAPRRLNNRELANSVRDVLLIEDVGTHRPLADLLGDTLQDGFDTNADAGDEPVSLGAVHRGVSQSRRRSTLRSFPANGRRRAATKSQPATCA